MYWRIVVILGCGTGGMFGLHYLCGWPWWGIVLFGIAGLALVVGGGYWLWHNGYMEDKDDQD